MVGATVMSKPAATSGEQGAADSVKTGMDIEGEKKGEEEEDE